MPIRLIVGLGNPGTAYEQTRHNAGVWGLRKIAKDYAVTLKHHKNFRGLHAKFQLHNVTCHLLMPTTFMNESGISVKALINYYKISLNDVLIIHDDLDLLPGIIRLKVAGGSGGHNGIKSIVSTCGDNDFWRLRIGIGHPGLRPLVSHYVLSQPCALEFSKIKIALQKVDSILPLLVKGENGLAIQTLHTAE